MADRRQQRTPAAAGARSRRHPADGRRFRRAPGVATQASSATAADVPARGLLPAGHSEPAYRPSTDKSNQEGRLIGSLDW
jgi:hypothetical protein